MDNNIQTLQAALEAACANAVKHGVPVGDLVRESDGEWAFDTADALPVRSLAEASLWPEGFEASFRLVPAIEGKLGGHRRRVARKALRALRGVMDPQVWVQGQGAGLIPH